MDTKLLISLLDTNQTRIRSLLEGITQKQAEHKPHPDAWSMLEVINHLYDEEREDFRQRIKGLLENPDQDFPPINPQAWVKERNYNSRDFAGSLENFLKEREKSLSWLASLSAPDWEHTYHSGDFSIRAGDIFASWVAHDQLHMRQIIELQRDLTVRASTPYQVDYAGEW